MLQSHETAGVAPIAPTAAAPHSIAAVPDLSLAASHNVPVAAPVPAVHHAAPVEAVHHAAPAPVVHHAAAAPAPHITASQYHAQDEEGNYSFGYSNPNSAREERGNPYTGVTG